MQHCTCTQALTNIADDLIEVFPVAIAVNEYDRLSSATVCIFFLLCLKYTSN